MSEKSHVEEMLARLRPNWFVYHSTGRLWSEKLGVEEGKIRNLKPVWGSRR